MQDQTRHIPVMLNEVVACFEPLKGKTIADATFGAGGYSTAFLEAGARVIAIDRDPDAIAAGRELEARWDGRLNLHHGRFSALDTLVRMSGDRPIDGVVADIGVSSMQIDQAERGFSFQSDGPLDMRMEQAGPSAADVVNTLSHGELTRIIGRLGEERQASRIASAIVRKRAETDICTTRDLAALVEAVLPRKHNDRIHPATRTFQALRMFVNGELEELAQFLKAAERSLAPGGTLAIVSFHSLEDRLVKRFLRDRAEQPALSRHQPDIAQDEPTFSLHRRNGLAASQSEAERNPRARSARLRWATRTATPPRFRDADIFGLPRLAALPAERG